MGPVRRLPLSIAAAAAALLACAVQGALPAASQAALKFEKCQKAPLGECATLKVPIDRAGSLPGQIPLYIERARAERRGSTGAVVALAGGPGEAAAALTRDFARALEPALKRRDLIVFDQRGTGRSGALSCNALERAPNPFRADKAVERCAAKIGPRRAFYTTRDSVADIEAIRAELGVEKITLFGVSYGTKVALAYAQAFPNRFERLVLDSVLDVDGPDPLYLESFQAIPRVLSNLCGSGACEGITTDPNGDLAALVRQLQSGPLSGPFIKASGRRTTSKVRRSDLFSILLAGDFDPSLRAALPAALRSVQLDDPAPLLRLRRRAFGGFQDDGPPAFSDMLFVDTICEEAPQPWPRTTPFAQRLGLARAAAAGLPDSRFAPFDRDTAVGGSDIIQLCEHWPTGPNAPTLAGSTLPVVPTLILNGEDDLRTPVETAQRVAGRIPGSRVLKAPDTGHSVLAGEATGCATRALDRFFRDSPAVTTCRGGERLFPPTSLAPSALSKVPPKGASGRRGRTLKAVELTIEDLRAELTGQLFAGFGEEDDRLRAGGLRAGRFVFDLGLLETQMTLKGFSYVPGVRLTGALKDFDIERNGRGTIVVSGGAAAEGKLKIRGTRVTGELDGEQVSLGLRKPPALPSQAAAARSAGPIARPPGR